MLRSLFALLDIADENVYVEKIAPECVSMMTACVKTFRNHWKSLHQPDDSLYVCVFHRFLKHLNALQKIEILKLSFELLIDEIKKAKQAANQLESLLRQNGNLFRELAFLCSECGSLSLSRAMTEHRLAISTDCGIYFKKR